MRRIVLTANTSWYLYNFRRPLVRALQCAGYEPILVAPRDDYSELLLQEGLRWRGVKLSRGGVNPLQEASYLADLASTLREERPDLLHNMTIKPVVYGSLAARVTGSIPVVNSITGLGHVFINKGGGSSLLKFIASGLYRLAFRDQNVRGVFENPDDLNFFVEKGYIRASQAVLIRGVGVDTNRFSPPLDPLGTEVETVFMASRLLSEKGVEEFVDAARLLRQGGCQAQFVIAGGEYDGNPSAIPRAKLESWKQEGIVDFLGHVDNIAVHLSQASIVVLPSYREGLPVSLLEAAAMGKPIVTTDVPGCREVVDQGVNGLLVPPRQFEPLAQAIGSLLQDKSLRGRMGEAGRDKAVSEFSTEAS